MRLSPSNLRLRLASLAIVLLSTILAGQQSIFAQGQEPPALPDDLTVHVVRADETLGQIAHNYGVPVSKLLNANGLGPGESARVGDRLLVPGTLGATRSLYEEEFVVSATDNLFVLAKLTNTNYEVLGRQLTAVNPYGFYVGQTIYTEPVNRTYAGGSQDSLLRIGPAASLVSMALSQNVSVYTLTEANDIANPVLVSTGTLIRVPHAEAETSTAHSPWLTLSITPSTIQTGRTVSISIQTDEPGVVTGRFLDQDVPFVSDGTTHHTVIGVSRWQEPGIYVLELRFTDNAGLSNVLTMNLQIVYGGYISESLRIPEEIAAVLNDPQAVQAEIAYVASVMSGFTPDPMWSGSFLLPASGVMTSAYGTLRSYNGSGFNTFHSGADLAARTGTPILAPADGIVVNIAELDVRGLVTMIDHGFGVYTGYWHQSSILVEPGDTVTRGQQIGSIGSTGLSTAAHLHWELWIRGTQVDAMQWVRESFP